MRKREGKEEEAEVRKREGKEVQALPLCADHEAFCRPGEEEAAEVNNCQIDFFSSFISKKYIF